MANVNNPSGFKPYASPGAAGSDRIFYFDLNTSNTAIGIGAPVASISGLIDIWSSGALMGFSAEYKAANSGGKIGVWFDPMQLFTAQCDDGTGTATSVAGAQANATIIVGAVSGVMSTAEIDESSATTTATLPLKLLRLSDEISNAYGEFNRWVVKINNHQLQGGTGTAGT